MNLGKLFNFVELQFLHLYLREGNGACPEGTHEDGMTNTGKATACKVLSRGSIQHVLPFWCCYEPEAINVSTGHHWL